METSNPSGASRALIADDDVGICAVMSLALRKLGIVPVQAINARELNDSLSAGHPAIIFLDLSIGGLELIEALAARKYRGAVQVMSGRGEAVLNDARDFGERCGLTMPPPLAKPFRMAVLKPILERLGICPSD